MPRQKSTLCLDFNGTLRCLVHLAAWEEKRAQKVRKSRAKCRGGGVEGGERRDREQRENEKDGPTEEVRQRGECGGKKNEEGLRERIRFLFIRMPYTSFMARPPLFALSFHLVTSLRLVTVPHLASPCLALLSPSFDGIRSRSIF